MGAFITWKPKNGGPSKSLFFDVCTEESQEFKVTATEHPIEKGANVSDHVRKELDTVTLEFYVSNAPIYDTNDRGGKLSKVAIKLVEYKAPFAPTPGAVFAAVGGAVKGAIGALLGSGDKEYAANVLQWDTTFDAVADTLAVLQQLQDDAQLVDVVMTSKLHENMLVEKIGPKRNLASGDGATFSVDFKQIQQVEVRLVNAPKPTEIRGATPKAKGPQPAKDAKSPGPKKSIAKSLIDKLLGG